jgi:hypothetical protein
MTNEADGSSAALQGMCCFCGGAIVETETDPCRVTVENKHGAWQVWFAHGDCFKEELADPPDNPGFFEAAHL